MDTLTTQLRSVHRIIGVRYPFVERIAVALYEPASDLLKTFVSSNEDGKLLQRYEARLADVPSLVELARTHHSRVVSDIDKTFASDSVHTAWLKERGYRASYTVPVYQGETLAAFLFFDSKQESVFTEGVTSVLETFAGLISQIFLLQLRVTGGMLRTVQMAVGVARGRDPETGSHLERVANYSRIMVRALSPKYGLSDEYGEYVQLFSPLHDIGKVSIPDRVLLKPGKLDADEWVVMRSHVELGEKIIQKMVHDLNLENSLSAQVMHNIVAAHHERGDGSGYPRGLRMKDIPMEARIVAVADVYDALSNRRPYKRIWTEEECAHELCQEAASGRLDHECVEALLLAKKERREVLDKYAEANPEPTQSEVHA
jgi:HD-GYP domain-containing protein (c-di-GMP phosphodiesterase class II)